MGRKFKDYTGQVCGCWKVIERDYFPTSSSHETFWKCEYLNCGNKASVRKRDLDKKPKSCNNCKGKQLEKYPINIGDKYRTNFKNSRSKISKSISDTRI